VSWACIGLATRLDSANRVGWADVPAQNEQKGWLAAKYN